MVQATPAAAPVPVQTQPPAAPAPAAPATQTAPAAPPSTPPAAPASAPPANAGPTKAEYDTLKAERDRLSTQVTETNTAVEQLRTQMNEMKMQGIPTEQRAQAQRELDLQAERRALDTRAGSLNTAALAVMAQDIANKTGVEVTELQDFATTTEMQEYAINRQVELQADPDYVGAMARLHGYVKAPADPNVPPVPGQAPGATQPPAGAPTQNAGTQPIGEDVMQRILNDPKIGRGSGNLEGALEAVRSSIGMTDLVFVNADAATPETTRVYQPPTPANAPTQQPAQTQQGQVPGAEAGNPPGVIDVMNTNQ